MEDLDVDKSQSFYGRSIAYDGEYHIVQSSNPPCTSLNDLDLCCGTSRYRLRLSQWDHSNTGKWCGDNEDDAILEFNPRHGMSTGLVGRFEEFLKCGFAAPVENSYCLDISDVSVNFITASIAGEGLVEIPREVIKDIEFVGISSEVSDTATAIIKFASSPGGHLAMQLIDRILRKVTLDAEIEIHSEAFVVEGDKSIVDVTYSCSGANGTPVLRGWNYPGWTITKAKITHFNFVKATPLEIWESKKGSIVRTTVTPWLEGQPRGIPVRNAYLKATLQYTKWK